MAQKPCVGCVYFEACGNTNRTQECEGRVTKSQKKEEIKNEKRRLFRVHKEEAV